MNAGEPSTTPLEVTRGSLLMAAMPKSVSRAGPVAGTMTLAGCGRFSEWVASVPVVLVIVAPADASRPFDMGRTAQNILVASHSLGLASCPVTFHDEECVRRLLGIPDDHECRMGIGIGRPAPDGPGRRSSPRIPLDELVHWGRWHEDAHG